MKKIVVFIATTLLMINSALASTFVTESSNSKKVESISNRTENSVSATTYVIEKLNPNIKGIDILPAITKKYEGKVVVIDFWATWCGPCRAAMKQLDTIKDDLLKKGVVFVYVTGETSPLKNWEPMIKNIKGHHYRLTNSQWTDLCTHLEIPGIPAYMVLNKDGSVAYSNLSKGGYPGNDILQNNIEVALTK